MRAYGGVPCQPRVRDTVSSELELPLVVLAVRQPAAWHTRTWRRFCLRLCRVSDVRHKHQRQLHSAKHFVHAQAILPRLNDPLSRVGDAFLVVIDNVVAQVHVELFWSSRYYIPNEPGAQDNLCDSTED